MDVERFDAEISSYRPSSDGKTFEYQINLSYGGLRWTLFKRFSDFYSLHNELFADGSAALPRIPGKCLTRPLDAETGELRRVKLER